VRDLGKRNVLGVLIDAVDREAAVQRVIDAAREQRPLAVSALAVHGVMTGQGDPARQELLNQLDLVTPDGQPVRWALNLLHKTHLREAVRGSDLTLQVLEAASENNLPVFFYGSRQEVLDALVANLRLRFSQLRIVGAEPSKFRTVSPDERQAIVANIRDSGAQIVFVGLGCPRQEVFVYELRKQLQMPLIAVGAAFDYLSDFLPQPPPAFQRSGLEWLWRLALDPRRLWRRYLLLNPAYLGLLALQVVRVWTPQVHLGAPSVGCDLEA
jgi:N-acetylglucosaminyldiphosphoundecaprenol N-acetyl-beta-D-mannosaminyltransferase